MEDFAAQLQPVEPKKNNPLILVAVIVFLVIIALPPAAVVVENALQTKPVPATQTASVTPKEDTGIASPVDTGKTGTQQIYSASDYIYISQRYFGDAQLLSQKREQTAEDKKEIFTKLQSAIDTISEGIVVYPKHAELWAQRATMYQAMSQINPKSPQAAIADYEEAFKLSPQNPDYTRTLATLYQGNGGSIQKAVYYLGLTQTLKPNDPQVLYDLGKLQENAGLLKSAQISFTKLIPLVTDAGQKQQIQAELRIVSALLAQASSVIPAQSQSSIQSGTGIHPDGSPTGADNNITSTPSTPPAGLELVKDQQAMTRDVIVAAPDDKTSPYADTSTSNAATGTATIPAGQTTVVVQNTRVTDASPIYVVPADQITGSLSVTKKMSGSGFQVALDSPEQSDVVFKYWVTQ